MSGRGLASWMVCKPAPGIRKSIWSTPAVLLESRIACRRLPGPESFTFVTVRVAAGEGIAAPISSPAASPQTIRTLALIESSLETQREAEDGPESPRLRLLVARQHLSRVLV